MNQLPDPISPAQPLVEYDEHLNLVTIESPHGNVLTPNETYALYLAIRAILPKLPQPLREP